MWYMGDGWGWWMLFLLVWSGFFLAVSAWVVLGPIERRDRRTQISLRDRRTQMTSAAPLSSVAPLEILERRYAAGELTDEQFERMRQRLQRQAGG
jgi:uncharacterized membrane protein